MTSKERMIRTLEFRNPDRIPRDISYLPWADIHYPKELEKIKANFPADIITSPGFLAKAPTTYGHRYKIGGYIDEWGCRFENLEQGIIGQVKEPTIKNDDWSDSDLVNFPYEWLTVDIDKVNDLCKDNDKLIAAGCCPRPFEQLQFIRGTEQLYMDLLYRPAGMFAFIEKMHELYCRQLTIWAKTNVDILSIMDDWGSQHSLLIDPKIWIEIFKPMYKDYIEIAHKHGKKIHMHSDGYIIDILPHLVEMGLDTINAQIFCMEMEKLKQFKGKIAFWGEIDRQNLLPNGTIEDIKNAVRFVFENLWDNGGCVAMCEFGAMAKPENIWAVYQTWNEMI